MSDTGVESISVVRADCADFGLSCGREWLVTNGIGGFACGTVGGALTRRYHGLLVAALAPPVQRTVLVDKLEVRVRYAQRDYALATNEFADGTIDPHGHRLIESFRLEGSMPVWRYALGDALLEQRVWMEHGHNTTWVELSLVRSSAPAELQIVPLCSYRDYHSLGHGGWAPRVTPLENGCCIDAFEGARLYWIRADGAQFAPAPQWYWGFRRRVESERGLDDRGDLFRPGLLRATLQPGERLLLELSAQEQRATDGARERERGRQAALLEHAPQTGWVRRFMLAADQFVARRGSGGQTIIAGYPWFSDWGRDTMIALPGLLLATGRRDVAVEVLRTFARYVSDGMLPNRFPDAGEAPEYNTVDATLWYFDAVAATLAAGADHGLLEELYPVLEDIVDWHLRGTRYGIGVDPADGLLRAGAPGVQLTWMDAKVGDWVVTPRIGKPVEVNALWINALALMADFARKLEQAKAAEHYTRLAETANTAFRARFWYAGGGYLYDVVDGPEGDLDERGRRADVSLRPNQIIAVSLSHVRLGDAEARSVVSVCARELYTPRGLRSLAAGDPRYVGRYGGDPRQRDGAYHQGTVWSWLLGPFARAHYRVHGDAAAALSYLDGLADHLHEGCLGSVSEIFDADAPHAPRGCFAQAWGVAEPLRAWFELTRAAALNRESRSKP